MIGRDPEREVLDRLLARAVGGEAVFAVVTGAPGIGKSTLLRSLGDRAESAGFAVAARRTELEGAAPLWAWTSALAELGIATPRVEATDVAVPSGRFGFFERVASALRERASPNRPLAVILDDLQWADLSTVKLLRHLVDHPSLPGLVVAGGLRTTEPLGADGAVAISELLAHPAVTVVEVPPFGATEIVRFAAERLDRAPSPTEVAALADRSGGNPFLLGELIRWIPPGATADETGGTLPLAVRESVRRRLAVEDDDTRRVVEAVAVGGRAARYDLLASVTGLDLPAVTAAADAGVRAALLTIGADDGRATVGFVHDLSRQAVLTSLPSWARMELHLAIGTALRQHGPDDWASVLTHLAAAGPRADPVALADAAGGAAREAARSGAFDEAARHFAHLLALTDADGDTPARGRVRYEQGRALWAAERAEESAAALTAAAATARRVGDHELLARIALSWRGGELRAIFRAPDRRFVALLREALDAVPPTDSVVRCLLLDRLARCSYWDIGDPDALAMVEEAVAMARRLGDAPALVRALGTRFHYRWRPELARDRLRLADEIVTIASTTDDPELRAEASSFRIVALLELGWLRDAWAELARFEAAAAAATEPTLRLRTQWFHATRLLVAGDRPGADAMTAAATALATRMGRPDAAVERLGQATVVWAAEGRVTDVARLFSPGQLGALSYQAVVTMAAGLAGHPVEARDGLRAIRAIGLDRFARDSTWLAVRCGLLAAAAVGGDTETATLLGEELRPYADQWAVINPGIVVLGAVDHYLGLGAAATGRLDDARDHFTRAVAAHRREDAVALELLSRHELDRVVVQAGGADADLRSTDATDRVAELTARNTVPIRPLLAVVWPDPPPVASGPTPSAQRLVDEGDTWSIEFGGRHARLRDQRGLHHLRVLLERPGTDVDALALAGGGAGLVATAEGELLDEPARRAYRERLLDLQEDIDEAAAHHDLERQAQAEAERDALLAQLGAATGLGGRRRRFTGADERARVSVTKSIRSAIAHIGESLPELADHLTATVHTGGRCAYRPDPRLTERWITEQL